MQAYFVYILDLESWWEINFLTVLILKYGLFKELFK